MKEITGDVIHLQTEEIPDLRAGNEDRYAVGESDHDRPGKVFHHGAHAGHAEKH